MTFTQALPVSMRYVAVTKLIAGVATLLVSIALAGLSLFIWFRVLDMFGVDVSDARPIDRGTRGPIGLNSFFVGVPIFCFLIALSIYLWASACGVNRSDEVSAGVVALARADPSRSGEPHLRGRPRRRTGPPRR